jgi:hypothetical protein
MKTEGNSSDIYAKCTAILGRETELLEQIGSLQALVRNAVINREWVDFESFLKSLGEMGAVFTELETQRIGLFSSLENGVQNGETGFYYLASRLPAEERETLTRSYRELKMGIIRVRIANTSLMGYLNEAQTTVVSFLDAAFPDRKGRLYTRRGTQVPSDMRSMVLNQSL